MTTRRYGQHRAQQPMHLLFPFELVAHIATYLADDTGTLLACSITCRLWSNATRPQIFRDVTISSPHRLQALCDLIKGTPSIGSWIKKIIFAISRPRPCRDLLPTNWLIKTGEILRGLEKNLTRLRSIAFDSVEVGGDPADCTSFFEVLANFRTIRHVRVYECLLTVTSFCNFLCKLPLLESVSLEAPSPISLEGLVQGTGLIKISSLTLVFEWNQTKTRTWFTSAITAASLRNLVVDILEESYVGVTNRLLELTGPYLQTLDIMLPRYHESNAQSPSRLGTYGPSLATSLFVRNMHSSSFFLKLSWKESIYDTILCFVTSPFITRMLRSTYPS